MAHNYFKVTNNMINKRHKISEDSRIKMRNAKLGKSLSEETKRKMSLVRKGRKLTEEHKKNISIANRLWEHPKGNKHPNWLGGITNEKRHREFDNRFKKIILLRDNNCLVCGSNNNLQMHHINYIKLETSLENCCILCRPCHVKTNYNRKHWITFFQSLLKEKYNYFYNLIILEENL